MKDKPNSPKKPPSLRLVDSSIWIAFHRIGQLELLLRLPSLALSPRVHEELKRRADDLANRTKYLVTPEIAEMELANDDNAATTLIHLIQGRDGISRPDAEQAVYVRLRPEACLYMRDTDAQVAALRGGGDVRDHQRLVADMHQEGIIDEDTAQHLLGALECYFPRGKRR